MFLARQYGLLDPSFFDSLTPLELFLADNTILNSVIGLENDLQERASEERKDNKNQMPGVTRMVSAEERSEQLKRMRMENR